MILFLAAVTVAATPQSSVCPDVVTADALVCRALSAQKAGDPQSAAQAFEEAAKASPDKDPATSKLWAAAGNMWLVGAQPGKAAFALDRALATPGLEAAQRGEALLDRARAAEAQGDLKTARTKLTEAAPSISDDPFYWYFSAALAIREKDGTGAQTAIGKALTLAPSDPTSAHWAPGRGRPCRGLPRRRRKGPQLLGARRGARPPRSRRQGRREGAGAARGNAGREIGTATA